MIMPEKVKSAIRANFNAIENDTFTEENIKEFMIDLREIVKSLKSLASAEESQPEFKQIVNNFRDICECIAHSHINRGGIGNTIRRQINKLINEFNHKSPNHIIDSAVQPVGHINNIVMGLFFSYFNVFRNESRDKLFQLFESRKNNLALCIISLLQDVRIDLKQGCAILYLRSYENKYRLYCRVMGSSLEDKLKKFVLAEAEHKIIIDFPIIISDIIDSSNDCDFSQIPNPPLLFETYQNNGVLRLREVNRFINLKHEVILRRIKSSTLNMVEKFATDSFTERDIKLLLIDMREHANYLKSFPDNQLKPIKLNKCLDWFIEICNFVFHQNRENGLFEDYIRKNIIISKTQESCGLTRENQIEAYDIVMGLALTFTHYISQYRNCQISEKDILKNANNIILCIFSLLQQYSIELKNDLGKAFLWVDCRNNKYCLSARVFDLKSSEIIDVSLIYTQIDNIDDLTFEDCPQGLPKLINTYRDSNGVLRVELMGGENQ